MAESPLSLRSLFLAAKSKEVELGGIDSSSHAYFEKFRDSISTFEECQSLIERLAIFSPNETIEDIATSTIQ